MFSFALWSSQAARWDWEGGGRGQVCPGSTGELTWGAQGAPEGVGGLSPPGLDVLQMCERES